MQVVLEDPMAQSVIEALSDIYSRKIMLAATSIPRSVEEISQETQIPISTCYRRIHALIRSGVIVVDRLVLTSDGRKFEVYKCSIKDVSVNMGEGRIRVEATPNTDGSGRLYSNWIKIKPGVTNEFAESAAKVEVHTSLGFEELDPVKLRPKNGVQILGDCAVCHSQYVKCHAFNYGKENIVSVCLDCENRISIGPQINV